jgi:hypothetical protein
MGVLTHRRVLISAFFIASFFGCVWLFVHPVRAEAASGLSASASEVLTSLTAPVEVKLEGTLPAPATDVSVTVTLRGPGQPSIGTAGWPVAATVDQLVAEVAATFSLSVTIPADALRTPGAYEATVEVIPRGGSALTARFWVGKVLDPEAQTDLAMVWPVAPGVHRDPDGVFVDRTVQASIAALPESSGSVWALLSLADAFPYWHMTLAVDPAYLDQVLDLSDGYRESVDGSAPVEVAKDASVPAQSLRVLDRFKLLARLETLQVIPAPYAMPAYTVIANERWADGIDQMRLAKADLQQAVGLPAAPEGAYAPGLDLATGCIRYFSQASIDYVVASEEVTKDLAEEPENPLLPLRIQDMEGNRISLIPVDRRLSATIVEPWDADLFLATLAAEVASGKTGPFVVAPADDFALPPYAFLRRLGEQLGRASWLRTLTVKEVEQAYPPGTRPILLSRYGTSLDGFLDESMLDSLRSTHAAFSDLDGSAGPGAAVLSPARLLLYVAESRYWFAPGTSPGTANLGLFYQEAVNRKVRAELDKIQIPPGQRSTVDGSRGVVSVTLVNQASYAMRVQPVLTADGFSVEGDAPGLLELEPGENTLSFAAVSSRSGATCAVRLMAGETLVAESTVRVRFLSAARFIPWIAGGVVALALAGWLVVWRLRRRRKR